GGALPRQRHSRTAPQRRVADVEFEPAGDRAPFAAQGQARPRHRAALRSGLPAHAAVLAAPVPRCAHAGVCAPAVTLLIPDDEPGQTRDSSAVRDDRTLSDIPARRRRAVRKILAAIRGGQRSGGRACAWRRWRSELGGGKALLISSRGGRPRRYLVNLVHYAR